MAAVEGKETKAMDGPPGRAAAARSSAVWAGVRVAFEEPALDRAGDLRAAVEAAGMSVVDRADGDGHDVVIWTVDPDVAPWDWGTVSGSSVVALVDDLSVDGHQALLRMGVRAVVRRDGPPALVAAAAMLAACGYVVEAGDSREPSRRPVLLDRAELRWMRALASGTTVLDLAVAESRSERDMYRRLRAVYRKLGADDRTAALLELAAADLLRCRRSDEA